MATKTEQLVINKRPKDDLSDREDATDKSEEQTSTNKDYEWTKLQNVLEGYDGKGHIGIPIVTNVNYKQNVLIPIGDNGQKYNIISINQYNPTNDEQSEYMKSAEKLDFHPKSACFDNTNNTIYITGKNGICKIHLNTKITEIIKLEQGWKGDSTSVIIDNKLHIFSVYEDDNDNNDHNQHAIYDITNGNIELESRHNVELPNNDDMWHHPRFTNHFMLYLQRQRRLIFAGGEFREKIISYDINKNEWNMYATVSAPESPSITGVTITNDERYMIFIFNYEEFDFYDNFNSRSCIRIIDFEKDEMQQSRVKLPSYDGDSYHSFITYDNDYYTCQIIVTGYLRIYEQVQVSSDDLIDLIVKFWVEQLFHMMNQRSGNHWKIGLYDILTFQAEEDVKDDGCCVM